jgi:hypothetical protein
VEGGGVIVRLTQIDGKLPNLALMRLAAFHRDRGDEVVFSRSIYRDLLEPRFDAVYGSAIFEYSAARVARLKSEFPGAIVGGTGSGEDPTVDIGVENIVGATPERYDYSDYPTYKPSLGFTQRGCRFRCEFCVVPTKEGRPRPTNTIADIWRGPGHPKRLHLLDNDFFGQPKDAWLARIAEIRDGDFKVCINQGINVRVITDEAAAALASVEYRDDQFQERRIYTAWDSLGDENLFFRGIDRLERAGIPPKHVMAYMLVGFDPAETWERIHHRFNRMVERGVEPYPMVYDRSRRDLMAFQRWAVTGLYRATPFADYKHNARRVVDIGAPLWEAAHAA